MLKLHSYYRSSATYRVRIALEIKKLNWESIPVNLQLGEQNLETFLQHNPQGLVPLLESNGHYLSQSLAIIEFLEEMHPDTPLLPTDIVERSQVRRFAQHIAMEIHPLNNLRVLKYLENELGLNEDKKTAWYQHWIAEGFSALEQSLKNTDCEAQFCFGERPSLADVCLIPQVYNGLRFDCDFSDYPIIQSIWDHCMTLDAFKRTAPESQPDAPEE
jgi:maleylpyruvate isomerase